MALNGASDFQVVDEIHPEIWREPDGEAYQVGHGEQAFRGGTTVYAHEVLSELFELFLCFDMLDASNLASAERAARWYQDIEGLHEKEEAKGATDPIHQRPPARRGGRGLLPGAQGVCRHAHCQGCGGDEGEAEGQRGAGVGPQAEEVRGGPGEGVPRPFAGKAWACIECILIV